MSNNFNYDQSGLSVVNNLGRQNVTDRYQFLSCVLMYKCLNGMAPAYLADNFTHSVDIHDYNTRHASAGNLWQVSRYWGPPDVIQLLSHKIKI